MWGGRVLQVCGGEGGEGVLQVCGERGGEGIAGVCWGGGRGGWKAVQVCVGREDMCVEGERIAGVGREGICMCVYLD